MNIQEFAVKTGFEQLNQGDFDREVQNGCCCDLLSWVMARGEEGTAWVTVQTHLNVVAVASLHEFACIVLSENNKMEQDVLDKASEEGIAVFTTPKSSYEVCKIMANLGI